MIKNDKRKYSICIVSGSPKDVHYKHLDSKEQQVILCNICPHEANRHCGLGCPKEPKTKGMDKALIEAQKLANKTNRKVTVLQTVYNVYPDKERIQGVPDKRYCKDQETCLKFPFCTDFGCLLYEQSAYDERKRPAG